MANLTSVSLFSDYRKRGGTLSREEYSLVVREFNKEVMRQIIFEGKVFDMGSNLSTLQVVRLPMKQNRPIINWKASHERKAEIIKEGGTPYSKETSPEGEKYFQYFDQDQEWVFKFYWRKASCFIPNKTAYRLTVTRGKVGNKTALTRRVKSDPLAFIDYEEK